MALCVVPTVADTHLHLDGQEDEVCTVCAISEPGDVADVGRVDARTSEWGRPDSFPVFSTTLSTRPYESGRPRAPPVS